MKNGALSLDFPTQVHPRLSPGEWPPGVLSYTDPRLIIAVGQLRQRVDLPLFPSPLTGGHVRHRTRKPGNFNGDCHSVDDDNPLSIAGDYFCSWDAAWRYLKAAADHPLIKGLGIYTDMIFRGAPEGEWAMLHFDIRVMPDNQPHQMLEWVGWRENRSARMQYVYKQFTPADYHRILAERGKKGGGDDADT